MQDIEGELNQAQMREHLLNLIRKLKLPDRQIMHLNLEGLDASAIAEITQFSAANVATKISRLKATLVQTYHKGKTP